jgi:predicted lipoprotein with Yx(FWY)xxD motif
MKKLLMLTLLSISTAIWADTVPGVTDITIITHEGKKVELLTNVKGFTLYTFDPDGPDQSNCTGACAQAWPPVLLTADQIKQVTGDFRVVKRADGTNQLSFDSHPLYLYIGDKKPGDTNGDGLGGIWHIAIDED